MAFAVVLVILIVAGDLAAVLLRGVQHLKQKHTMADLRILAEALDCHHARTGRFPDADSVDALIAALPPCGANPLPRSDGWNRPLIVRSRSSTYRLASTGKDGRIDAPSLPSGPYPTESFDRDITYADGKFVSWPEGWATQ